MQGMNEPIFFPFRCTMTYNFDSIDNPWSHDTMVRFALKNPDRFKSLRKRKLLRPFITFKLTALQRDFPAELVREIFTSLFVADGTSRQTAPDRFADLDRETLGYLQRLPGGAVHDIAVSDGSTSLALLQSMRAANAGHPFYLSDKYSKAWLHRGKLPRVYDMENRLMVAYLGCFVAERSMPFFFISRILYQLIKRLHVAGGSQDETFSLYTQEVQSNLAAGRMAEIDYDVFSTVPDERFSFVRCMNLLNKVYFGDDAILAALKNIHRSMTEKGILLVGRTLPGGRNDAGFYEKSGNGFRLLRRVNSGSEIDGLIAREFLPSTK
jgi:hypothetical protein